MAKILVAFPKENHAIPFTNELRERLDGLGGGGQVTWADAGRDRTDETEYAALLEKESPEVLITFWSAPLLSYAVYQKNPQLKYACHVGGEMKRYVEKQCIDDGLIVTNWGDSISRTISEATLMMILASLRNLARTTLDMHVRKLWSRSPTRSLFGRAVGLHGMGPIAQHLVPLLRPFDVTISAYSPHAPAEVFENLGVERAESLKALYSDSDVISIHTGNTPANFHIVNAELLACMKDGAVLVNTARGPIVDTEALAAELKTGRIFAALDVFEEELIPPYGGLAEDSPLRGLENCLLIPHQGGPTRDQIPAAGRAAIENIERYLRGEEVIYRITSSRYEGMT